MRSDYHHMRIFTYYNIEAESCRGLLIKKLNFLTNNRKFNNLIAMKYWYNFLLNQKNNARAISRALFFI